MAGGSNTGGAANQHKATSPAPFRAPTVGCEHIIFDNMHGKKHKQAGNFDTNIETLSLAIVASGQIKRGKANVSKAMVQFAAPDFDKMRDALGTRPKEEADPFKFEEWNGNAREVIDEKRYWKENNQVIFAVLFSHCAQSMKTYLKSQDYWAEMFEEHNGLGLLSSIRSAVFGTDGESQSMLELVRSWRGLAQCTQYEKTDLETYYKNFEASYSTASSLMGPPGVCKATMTIVAAKDGLTFESLGTEASDNSKFKEYVATTTEAVKAALFFEGLNLTKYKELKANVGNAWTSVKQVDESPQTMAQALRLANKWLITTAVGAAQPIAESPGVAFIQPGEEKKKVSFVGALKNGGGTGKPDTVGTGIGQGKGMSCYHCNGKHPLRECDTATKADKDRLYKERDARVATAKAAREAAEAAAAPAANNVQEGHVHLGVSEEDIGGIEAHDDDYDEDFAFIQSSSNPIVVQARKTLDKHKVYLDSTSTFNQVFEEQLLTHKAKVSTTLRAHCNAGVSYADEKGNLLGMFDCWLVRNGIANILSIPQLERDGFVVEYVKQVWTITCPNGTRLVLKRDMGLCEGFPYLDIRELGTEGVAMAQMVETVRENREGFTKRQLEKATLARKAQAVLASPSEKDFMNMVSNNTGVKNIPVMPSDLTRANVIFGPDRRNVQGKTVREKSARVETDRISIPDDFHRLHHFVTLTGDVMFVNGVAFMMTLSRDINLVTAEFTPSRTAKQLGSSLMKVVKGMYERNGFVVNAILMDLEFESVKEVCPLVEINTVAAREHVGEIERMIRTVKDGTRCVSAPMPFEVLPKQFVIRIVYFATMMINTRLAANRVSQRFSPRELMTGRILEYGTSLPDIIVGSYVEGSTDKVITNTNESRTIAGIYLGPTGNIQGTRQVFCLKTGIVHKMKTVKVFPMPDNVIKLVNAWGRRYQKVKSKDLLTFLNRKKQPFEWENEELEDADVEHGPLIRAKHITAANIPDIELERDMLSDTVVVEEDTAEQEAAAAEKNSDLFVLTAETAGVSPGKSSNTPGVSSETIGGTIPSQECNSSSVRVKEQKKVEEDDDDDDTLEPEILEGLDEDYDILDEAIEDIGNLDISSDMLGYEDMQGSTMDDTPLVLPEGTVRSRKPVQKYNANFTNKRYDGVTTEGVINFNMDEENLRPFTKEDAILHVLGVIMIQTFSLKKGLEKFGEDGEKSVMKELQQHHDMETYHPVDPKTLTYEQRREALQSLIFLTEKRTGEVKTRSCADGSKQRRRPGYKKEDNASPTVANEATMFMAAINAFERRDIMSIDLPGAFLHTMNDEEIFMLLKGPLAELMVLVSPKLYRPYVTYDSKGVPLMYVRMNKAMYGLLKSALLFYRKLVADLEEIGFKLNPYDPCVANRDVNGSQQTVVFHVDDLHCSHIDPTVNTELALYLSDKYGDGIAVHRGDVHDYLGMDFDYSDRDKRTVKVSQIKYLHNIIYEFPEKIGEPAATPAADHLFKVRDPEDARYLDEERAQVFHRTTAQLLFLSSRSRRDIQTAVAFLTTRVKGPDEDDWGKLKRVLRYLKGTKHMKLTLSIDNMNVIKWWIDASDRTHMDCKGHTGGMMSLGKGAIMSYSSKQKINTKSSTESELVGADQLLSRVIWSLYFAEAQGYTIDQNILYQDNQSTMKLEVNGAMSSSKRTKHIHARYFFITDRVEEGEVDIQYCPTEMMWADVLTKPKQGKSFRLDRSHLMNVPIDYDDNVERRNTHPQLLPPDEDKPVQTLVPLAQSLHRRSVLGDKTNVSWSRLAGGKVPAQQPTTTAAIKHPQHVLQQ